MTMVRRWAVGLLLAYLLIRGTIILLDDIREGDWSGVAFSIVFFAFIAWLAAGFRPGGRRSISTRSGTSQRR